MLSKRPAEDQVIALLTIDPGVSLNGCLESLVRIHIAITKQRGRQVVLLIFQFSFICEGMNESLRKLGHR